MKKLHLLVTNTSEKPLALPAKQLLSNNLVHASIQYQEL